MIESLDCRSNTLLVLEAPGAALCPVPDEVGPDELDHPGIVIAIRKIVVEGGEAMLLANLLHVYQLGRFELVLIDVPPVVG